MDYEYFHLNQLADMIEHEFVNDGKYETENWSAEPDMATWKRPMITVDRLEGATDEQRSRILSEVKSLQKELRLMANRSKELEWFLSGDTGVDSYLERLDKVYEEAKK